MATTTTRLLTVAEYDQIPNPPGGRYELHHGELVDVDFPKNSHVRGQWQLCQLLHAAAGSAGRASVEFPCRPLPENGCRGAGMAYPENGSIQFWIVDTDPRLMEVSTPGGHSITCKAGQQIPLFFGRPIAVDEIFA